MIVSLLVSAEMLDGLQRIGISRINIKRTCKYVHIGVYVRACMEVTVN